MEVRDYCNGDYLILCICEGTAEEDIMIWLLEENRLTFTKEDLLEKRFIRTRTGKSIEEKYLGLDFDKPVAIFRIIDSKKENFKLSKLYDSQVAVSNFITNPEIEILMIFHREDFDDYSKKSSVIKPSEYASTEYRIKKIKNQGVMRDFFCNDIETLICAIKKHKTKKANSKCTIYDLLKEEIK